MRLKLEQWILALAALVCVGFACSSPESRQSSPPAPGTVAALSAPFERQELASSRPPDSTRLAFRREEAELTATAPSYRVRVTEGRFALSHAQRPTEVTFETHTLGREDARAPGTTESRLDHDGSVSLARGSIVERLRNTSEGLSQSWEIAERPEPSRDFVVRVEVSGASYAATTAGGLHFLDEETGARTRYGHGTWIDAAGIKTAVPARFIEGLIELRVPRAVVAESTYPAVLDPVIGPEFSLDEPVPHLGGQIGAISTATTDSGISLLAYPWGELICAIRLGPNGELLDENAFILAPAQQTPSDLVVATDGDDFFVAWISGESTPAVHGLRVSAEGTLLDATPLTIAWGTETMAELALAYGDATYVLVWTDYGGTTLHDLKAARISQTGVLLDPLPLELVTEPGFQRQAGIAFDGDRFLVAWSDHLQNTYSNISAARLESDGTVLDPGGFLVSSTGRYSDSVKLAFTGSVFLLTYRDTDQVSDHEIHAKRVTPDATVLDPAPLVLAATPDRHSGPRVLADGSNFLVVWSTQPPVSVAHFTATRVSTTGAILDPIPELSGEYGQRLAGLLDDGLRYWILHTENTPKGAIFGVPVGRDGEVIAPGSRILAAPVEPKKSPALASSGNNFLAVWRDNRRSSFVPTTYGLRLTPSGESLDPAAFPIASWTGEDSVVASNGEIYLVVWTDVSGQDTNILARRLSSSGEFLDPSPLLVSVAPDDQLSPSVTSDGMGFFVVWEDHRGDDEDIYGCRVSAGGVVLDPEGARLSFTTAVDQTPSVVSSDDQYLVAWRQEAGASDYELRATRVDRNGAALDRPSLRVRAYVGSTVPRVSSDGTDFLVVWEDEHDIWGARLSETSVLLDPDPLHISSAAGIQQRPSVAHDGASYVLSFSDDRNGIADIYATRVDSDGTVLDFSGFEVHDSPLVNGNPALAFNGAGTGMVAYTTTDEDIQVHARVLLANCTPTNIDETACNGVDDDCDGQTDEDYVAPPTECGTGPCAGHGVLMCSGGVTEDTCAPPADGPEECFPAQGTGGGGSGSGGGGDPTGGASSGGASSGGAESGGSGGSGATTTKGGGDAPENGDGDGDGDNTDGDVDSGPNGDEDSQSVTAGCDCGCRVAQGPARPSAPWAGLALLSLLLLRRRRTRQATCSPRGIDFFP